MKDEKTRACGLGVLFWIGAFILLALAIEIILLNDCGAACEATHVIGY